MPYYIDSSLVVALLFGEKPHSRALEAVFSRSPAPLSSMLLEAEVYAAARRENFATSDVDDIVERINLIFPERSFAPEYARIFAVSYCRGADAHHLATALSLDPTAEELTFLTADKKQADIARKLGFKTQA